MKIEDIERIFDDRYQSVKLPGDSRDMAKWMLVTVAEDYLLILASVTGSLHQISLGADKQKYSIKYALSRIESELDDEKSEIPKIIDANNYGYCQSLLAAGEEFSKANLIFSFLHSGLSSYTVEGNSIELHDKAFWKKPGYSALEMIPLEANQQEYMLQKVFSVLNKPPKTKFYESLKNQCEIGQDGIIRYNFNYKIFAEFAKEMALFRQEIPDSWIFPWGLGETSKKLLWALSARCFFHMATIRTAASYDSIEGAGLESLCLITDKSTIAKEMVSICNVELVDAIRFLSAISIGEGTRTADPALQPIIKLSDGRILIGCLKVLTSRQDRNLLALHARVGKDSFDKQSSIFEEIMVEKIALLAVKRNIEYLVNFNIPGAKEVGDLDVVLFDRRNKFILVCELRWVIQPGDPREIMLKAKACIEKIEKINKKVGMAKCRIPQILERVGINNADPAEWGVRGIIIIDGYAGVESTDDSYPIMPLDIFLKGLNIFTKIDRLYKWAKSLAWLPQVNKHYRAEIFSEDFDKLTISRPGFSIMETNEFFKDFLKKTIKDVR